MLISYANEVRGILYMWCTGNPLSHKEPIYVHWFMRLINLYLWLCELTVSFYIYKNEFSFQPKKKKKISFLFFSIYILITKGSFSFFLINKKDPESNWLWHSLTLNLIHKNPQIFSLLIFEKVRLLNWRNLVNTKSLVLFSLRKYANLLATVMSRPL